MLSDRSHCAGAGIWCALVVAVATAGAATAASPTRQWSDPSLAELARAVPIGGELRIEGAVLDPGGPPEAIDLERFRVFSPDARIVVHGPGGAVTLPAPAHAYLRGTVAGRPGSRVVLTALEGGGLRGLIAGEGRYWLASQGPGERQASLVEVTDHPALAADARRFVCDADRLPRQAPDAPPAGSLPPGGAGAGPGRFAGVKATARVAVETDYEYYQRFGSVAGAVGYAGDLFAYASTYYTAEVSTDFWVSYVSVWTTSSDPWTQTSSLCGLAEFGQYWNKNNAAVSRTIAHFLSGKPAGGGVAWVGVLCASAFSVDISSWGCTLTPTVDMYGGDFGFSGDLAGDFNISSPSVVWDIYVVSHEVGHNFNTGHTHCYVPPVDQCWGNDGPPCYNGPPSLPCPTPGGGCGTIMSYCHTITPGMANISLTLGLTDPWGYQPWRVPNLMSSYVASVAASNPLCLLTVFADGLESGDGSAWSSTRP